MSAEAAIKKLHEFAKLAVVISDDIRTNFEKFTNLIKESYIDRQANRDLQWPPCFAEKLVKLELHQEVYNVYYNKQQRGGHYSSSNREQVEYDGIFESKKGGRKVKKVLIEGDAGIGKTTLCTSISVEWAQKKRLKQFELLLLLPLRAKEVISANSVVELLQIFHPNKKVCESVAEGFLQQELGKHVLVIADGWDELNQTLRNQGSFIYKLLFQNAIHSATIMITSRPSASVALHKNPDIDRFIEIAGFDRKGIEQYINSEFSTDREKESRDGLLQQVNSNPLIRSICHVPINCAIVCHMWRCDESLPSDMTLTDIYTMIILHFMLRAFQKTFPDFGIESLNSFDAIPAYMQDHLGLLCEAAYDALLKDTFVFSYEELKSVFPEVGQLSGETFTFGLMQAAQAFLGVGRGVSFHFLHRTFQEYLSALHVVRQSSQQQIALLKPHAYTSRMAMVMRFVIGLGTSGKRVSSEVIPLTCATVRDVYEIDYRVRVSCVGWTNDLVVHGIYEAKEGDVKNYLLNLVYGDYFTFAFPRNAHDCATVVRAIDHFKEGMQISNKTNATVSFKFEHCGLDEELLTNLAVALYKTEGKLHVKMLLIQDSDLSDGSISMFMNLAASAFQSIKQLSLAANKVGAETINVLSECFRESSLEHLTLSYNPLGDSGALALNNAIKADTLANLTDLQLKNCSLSNSQALASLLQVLPDHCPNLKQLDICENVTKSPILIGKSIGRLIHDHKNLSELYANEICLGDEGMKTLTDVLSSGDSTSQISILSIKKNGIQSEGISLLANCIKSSHLSISDGLCVDGNSIELKGAVSLGAVLNIKSVSMSDCQLTMSAQDSSRQNLIEELSKVTPALLCQELILDGNCFHGDNTPVLAGFVRICPKLNSLSCARCEINSEDLKYLLTNPNCSLTGLETWSLQHNDLDDKGCSQLVTTMPTCLPKITGIFLHGNPKIKHKRLFELLEDEVAKHRPQGDVFERVLTAFIPGVPYDKLRVIVEKHDAYEELTNEDQDPVLLWDDYIRRGEEQRQQAEVIMGWTMSFQDEKRSAEIIKAAMETFSMKKQKMGADLMSALGNLQHYDYQPLSHSDEEEDSLNQTESLGSETLKEHKDETGIKLPGGGELPSSVVSSLATQYLGKEAATPDLVGALTQFGQSSLGQVFLGQVMGGDQGYGSLGENVDTSQLCRAAQCLFQGQGNEEQPNVSGALILNGILQQLSGDIDYSAVDSQTILGEDDLRDVSNEVSSLKPVYFQLGIALGVPPSEVEAIKNSCHHNPEQALTEVLLKWLRGHYTASSVMSPTWQNLVKAVDSPTCNSHLLAQDIASRHSARCPPTEM